MQYASLTQLQLDSLRPTLATIATLQARRATSIGGRIPPNKQPPQAYDADAVGWTVPFAVYPQRSGMIVVVMEDAAHAVLNPPSRALFTLTDLPSDFGTGNP